FPLRIRFQFLVWRELKGGQAMRHLDHPSGLRRTCPPQLVLILIALDAMSQIDMRDLVTQHGCQLRFRSSKAEEARGHEDLSARERTRVDLASSDHLHSIPDARPSHMRNERPCYLRSI